MYIEQEAMPYTTNENWTRMGKILTSFQTRHSAFIIKPAMEIGDVAEYKNVQLYDLTEIYGVGNEPNDEQQIREDLFL